jgi:exonuclease SbcC
MRIEKVVIENINSLAGRFEVDFTDRGYSGGLFAITGPSGAGKTTVLDAICLALYGQTPRIKDISATRDEIMTKGTDDCSAEAVFVSRGKRYRAIFSHRRSAGANPFRPVEREIIEYMQDGFKTVAASIREADAKIVEVTGLDYTRFTRSIMLAQFRFAEFLKASANERAEILEQVTDMGMYRRISAAVYERLKQEEAALEKIRNKFEFIAVPDEAQEAAYARELKALEAALPKQTGLRETLRQCADVLTRADGFAQTLAEDTAQTPVLQKALAESEARLEQAQHTEQRAGAALAALRETLKTVRALDIKLETQRKECARIDKAAQEQDAAIREHKRRILEVFKNYEPEAAPERLKAMYEADDTAALLRTGVQKEMDEAEKRQQEVKAKTDSLLGGHDEAHWQHRIEILKTALALADTNEALNKAQANSEEEAKAQRVLIERYKEATARTDEAKERYEYALLDQRFGEERSKLAEGAPCPLCGATQHPYSGKAEQEGFFAGAEAGKKEAEAALRQIERGMAESGQRRIDIASRIKELKLAIEQHIAALDGEMPEASEEELKAALEDARKRVKEYPALLKEQAEAADEAGKLAARMGEVDKNVQAIMLRKEQIGEAQRQADALRDELKTAQGLRDEYTKQREALFGGRNPDAEEAAADKAAKYAQDMKEQRRVERDAAATALAENSRDIYRAREALEKERSALTDTCASALSQAKGLELPEDGGERQAAFAAAAAALTEKPERSALSAAAEALGKLISSGTEQKALIAQRLKDIDRDRKALHELKIAEREQKQVYIKWGNLNKLIGSADGSRFPRMAQGITFDALLRYANVSLSRMTDQYVLVRDMTDGAKPLELAVLDMYRAGEQRPVSNLSGGESFLVSLALALGLSEMSSGRARIDSLFIDEGFASLDESYLEAALQTLSTLSTREDKLVGVISHVEALKERIDAQITVVKRSGGRSTLLGPGVTAAEA